jgi:glucokinase
MMALGTGVGGGVILHGRLITGVHQAAGEIGHTVLDPLGPLCACGNRGCLEAWAGSSGLLRRARALADGREVLAPDGLGPDPDPDLDRKPLADLLAARGARTTTSDLAALAETGDPLCRALFAEAGRRLGQATANLVNVLDPDRVIIGGGVAAAGDLILAPCRAVVPGLVLGEEAAKVPIVTAELGSQAAAVGAAWLARERVREN